MAVLLFTELSLREMATREHGRGKFHQYRLGDERARRRGVTAPQSPSPASGGSLACVHKWVRSTPGHTMCHTHRLAQDLV